MNNLGVESSIVKLIVVVILAVVLLYLLVPSFTRAYNMIMEYFGLAAPKTLLEKAVLCSYYRCVNGCYSTEAKTYCKDLKAYDTQQKEFNDGGGTGILCDFKDSNYERGDNQAICGENAKAYPVVFESSKTEDKVINRDDLLSNFQNNLCMVRDDFSYPIGLETINNFIFASSTDISYDKTVYCAGTFYGVTTVSMQSINKGTVNGNKFYIYTLTNNIPPIQGPGMPVPLGDITTYINSTIPTPECKCQNGQCAGSCGPSTGSNCGYTSPSTYSMYSQIYTGCCGETIKEGINAGQTCLPTYRAEGGITGGGAGGGSAQTIINCVYDPTCISECGGENSVGCDSMSVTQCLLKTYCCRVNSENKCEKIPCADIPPTYCAECGCSGGVPSSTTTTTLPECDGGKVCMDINDCANLGHGSMCSGYCGGGITKCCCIIMTSTTTTSSSTTSSTTTLPTQCTCGWYGYSYPTCSAACSNPIGTICNLGTGIPCTS